jgi:hypothetical protein
MKSYVALIALAVAVAGCGGGSSSVTTGASQNAPTATVTVDVAETLPDGSVVEVPAVGVTVTLSTGVSGTTPTGVLATAVTTTAGTATFTSLPPAGQLCISAASASLFAARCKDPLPGAVTLQLSTPNQIPGTPQPGNGP